MLIETTIGFRSPAASFDAEASQMQARRAESLTKPGSDNSDH